MVLSVFRQFCLIDHFFVIYANFLLPYLEGDNLSFLHNMNKRR